MSDLEQGSHRRSLIFDLPTEIRDKILLAVVEDNFNEGDYMWMAEQIHGLAATSKRLRAIVMDKNVFRPIVEGLQEVKADRTRARNLYEIVNNAREGLSLDSEIAYEYSKEYSRASSHIFAFAKYLTRTEQGNIIYSIPDEPNLRNITLVRAWRHILDFHKGPQSDLLDGAIAALGMEGLEDYVKKEALECVARAQIGGGLNKDHTTRIEGLKKQMPALKEQLAAEVERCSTQDYIDAAIESVQATRESARKHLLFDKAPPTSKESTKKFDSARDILRTRMRDDRRGL